MADNYRAQPRRTVELATLLGPPIPAEVLELLVDEQGVRAAFELTGAAFARAAAEGQLGLDAPGRGPGPEPAADRPVRVDARLRPALAGTLDAGDPMAALLRHLYAPPAALAHADAWRALAVTQRDVDEPAVALGYQTGWAAARTGALDEMAIAALDRLGLASEVVGEGLLRAAPPGGGGIPWMLLVRVDAALGLLAVYGVIAALVPEENRARAAVELALLSTEQAAGGFDLDPVDGEVRFRIEHLSADATIARESVEHMVRMAIDAIDEHRATLAALVGG